MQILRYTTKDGYTKTIGGIFNQDDFDYTMKQAKKDGAKEVVNPETKEIFKIK
jgi:hypothetical protein